MQQTPDLITELRAALHGYSQQLVAQGQPQQAAWLYRQTCSVLPGAAELWHDAARALLAAGQLAEALESLRRARQLSANHPLLRESLDNATALVVERWHFRMLNDGHRNRAYAAALRHAVAKLAKARQGQDIRALDIGAGTGILSVLAVRAGAAGVTACEMNPTLASVARQCVEANGCRPPQVQILATHSGELQPADDDDAKGFDLIVTELVDAGLLGEHIVPVLADARRRLLRPDGVVIPHSATVSVGLVHCDAVHNTRRLQRQLPVNAALNLEALLNLKVADSYTCENLALVDHAFVSAVQSHVMNVVFSAADPQTVELEFEIKTPGLRVDALALWWDMHLLDPAEEDGDAGTIVSSNPFQPRAARCGWDQALYPLSLGCSGQALAVGSRVRLQLQHDTDCFNVVEDGVPATTAPETALKIDVGELDLALINDAPFHQAMLQQVTSLALDSDTLLVFLVRDHSYWVLHALQVLPSWRAALIVTDSAEGAQALQHVLDHADAPLGARANAIHISSVPAANMDEPALQTALDRILGAAEPSSVVLMLDLVEGSGLLRQGILHQAWAVSRTLQALCSGMPVATVPAALRVQAQVFQSDLVRSWNAVCPDETAGVDVRLFDGLCVRRWE